MIDIETLATDADAVIIQIGATVFPITHQEKNTMVSLPPDFLCNVSATDQINLNRKIDPKTVAWWLDETTVDARVSVFDRHTMRSFEDALGILNGYIATVKDISIKNQFSTYGVWANSPTFDLSIIRHAMKQVGIEPSWSYSREYDVRTIKQINTLL